MKRRSGVGFGESARRFGKKNKNRKSGKFFSGVEEFTGNIFSGVEEFFSLEVFPLISVGKCSY
ncbi:MAG: hypothetical protein KIG35_08380 [Prevotellamassilia sp.]|nr:hypothetical protein [Prevotellamassilia sp.]